MGRYLTTASEAQCPHGGQVVGVVSQTDTTEDGAPLLASTDLFAVEGCPFVDATDQPSPCMQVVWSNTAALQVGMSGGHALDETSVGMALDAENVPQGQVVVTRW